MRNSVHLNAIEWICLAFIAWGAVGCDGKYSAEGELTIRVPEYFAVSDGSDVGMTLPPRATVTARMEISRCKGCERAYDYMLSMPSYYASFGRLENARCKSVNGTEDAFRCVAGARFGTRWGEVEFRILIQGSRIVRADIVQVAPGAFPIYEEEAEWRPRTIAVFRGRR